VVLELGLLGVLLGVLFVVGVLMLLPLDES